MVTYSHLSFIQNLTSIAIVFEDCFANINGNQKRRGCTVTSQFITNVSHVIHVTNFYFALQHFLY
jgi:hypothetical protein